MGTTVISPRVTVLYALPAEQLIVEVDFEFGMTAAEAIRRSGLPQRFAEIDSAELVPGIWGIAVSADTELKPGDRVEISRPLRADPRAMRRDMLTGGRVMGGAVAAPKFRKSVPE